jgi:ribosomal protein S18 acetylase RimI-like enzyme
MIIRKMMFEDIEACAQLVAESALWQRYGVTEESAARRFEGGLAQQAGLAHGEQIAVAEVDEKVAGFIWYSARGAFNRSGYIMLVGAAPEQRSRGVGRALMDHAEEELFRDGCGDIFLLVSDFNEGAQRFYQRLGYRQVGAIPDYIISGVAELIYHKPDPSR